MAVSGKKGKERGAEVRASRARSRVVAEKKKAKARKEMRVRDSRVPRKPPRDRAGEAGSRTAKGGRRGAGEKGRTRREKAGTATAATARRREAQKARNPSTVPPPYDSGVAVKDKGKSKQVRRRLQEVSRKTEAARRETRRGAPAGEPYAPERGSSEGQGGRNRSSPVRIAVLGAVLVTSLAGLLWIYTNTGVLNVKSVEVRGNERLDTAYLRSLSGITRDTHLLKMNVKAVEDALISEPYVAEACVSRRYPHTVVLEITERKPAAFVLQNGTYDLLDLQGVVLESVGGRPAGMVEIEGLELPLLLPGGEIDGDEFTTIASLLGSLPAALREMTTAVGIRGEGGLYLEGAGTVVNYGHASDLERKNEIALMALTELLSRYGSVEYIDVSFPEYPVIKPAGSGQAATD